MVWTCIWSNSLFIEIKYHLLLSLIYLRLKCPTLRVALMGIINLHKCKIQTQL